MDVHRRADRGNHILGRHGAGLEEPSKDIVWVASDYQLIDWNAHLFGGVAGKHISKIAGRHSESDRAIRRTESRGSGNIVTSLGGYAGPVYRIHRAEPTVVAERDVVEHCFYQVLAVIECALNCDVMNVVRGDSGHLATLHLGYAPSRVQDDNVDGFSVAARLDSSRSSIARCCADDGDALAAPGEYLIEQSSDDLQRIVFEGQRWPVEQF